MTAVFVVSDHVATIRDFCPHQLECQFLGFDRNSRNTLKKSDIQILILDLLDKPNNREVQQLLKAVSLNNHFYLLVLVEKADCQSYLDIYAANEAMTSYDALQQNGERLVKLNQLLSKNKQQLVQVKAQTALLLSINHFAQFTLPWQQLINDFAASLAQFCHSTSTLLLDNKRLTITEMNEGEAELSESSLAQLKAISLPSTETAQPNVNLLVEDALQTRLEAETGKQIEAILSFPLVVYDQVIQSVVCLIDKAQMANVSVQQIDIMKEASLQLRILIERRVAENKLKSQFQRLKNALQELQVTKDQLVHSEKMAAVGKLAAGIAHEINNPLSYVLGNLEPLDEYVETIVKLLGLHDELLKNLDETLDEQPQKIRSQIVQEQTEEDLDFVLEDIKAIVDNSKDGLMRVRDIINDLSSFSRQQPLQQQTFLLDELIQQTIKLLKFELSNGIKVEIASNPKLALLAHRGFVQQILTNLVKNAVNAIQDAGIEFGVIEISSISDKDSVHLIVKDNGPGIPEQNRQSIFTPFFTTKKVGKGTGLGLSVSYNLAKKMSGQLTLDDAEQGSQFTLTLPKQPLVDELD